MKKIRKFHLLVCLVILPILLPAQANANPLDIKLPFKTAIIHYDITGSQKGTETLYIRDSGNERVKVTRSKGKIMFVKTKTNTVEIVTRDHIVQLDLDKKTGTKFINPQKLMQQEFDKLSKSEQDIVVKNLEQTGMNMATQLGGKVTKSGGSHLGYECDLVSVMGTTSCQMSNSPIMLKTSSSLGGITMNTVATKIEKNVAIPASVFTTPAGVTVIYDEQTNQANRSMIASMVQSMKDPDAASKMQQQMRQAEDQGDGMQDYSQYTDVPDQQTEQDNLNDQKEMEEMKKKAKDVLKGLFQ